MTTYADTRTFVRAAGTEAGAFPPALIIRQDAAAVRPAWLKVLGNLAGVVGITFLIPFAIIGLPLALAWRAILDATEWRSRSAENGHPIR